jgi:hypothetical protein
LPREWFRPHQPKPFDHSADHGTEPRAIRHRAVAHPGEVFGGVDEREVGPAGRFGLDAIRALDHAVRDQAIADQRVLAGRKDVRPDVDLIPGGRDDDQRGTR